MAAPKRIVVFGVTGQQGGSVAKYLLEDKQYQVVGITRNPESARCKKLKEQGVELFAGDLDQPDTLVEPLKGAYGAFLNTNWWQCYKGDSESDNAEECTEREGKQAKNAIDKIKAAGIQHLIYSTLGVFKLDGRVVEHCYSKVLIKEYIEKNHVPVTSVNCSYYMENVLGLAPSEERSDGSVLLINPLPDDTKIPTVAIGQLGLFVRHALNNRDEFLGKEIDATTDFKSNGEIAEILTEVTGRKFETQHNTPEQFLADKGQAKEMKINSRVFFEGLLHPEPEKARKLVGAWDYKEWALKGGEVEAKWGLKN